MFHKEKNGLKSYAISPSWCTFQTFQREISTLFSVMFQNVSESKNFLNGYVMDLKGKNGSKTYVISPVWCSFHTNKKLQLFLKPCSRMSLKGKMDLKFMRYCLLDVIFIWSINFNPFLSHVPRSLGNQKFPEWFRNIPRLM